MGRDSTKSLVPGFRFHPTDEELVRYYLKRKVSGKSLRFDAITQFDVYKSEPWNLPDKSKMQSRDLEWYFFSALDKKYGNGSKTNRATHHGYWKTTGKDRPVYHDSRVVGMKKTLVFHEGRAPRGARSNWVMHEYRLVDEELEKAGVVQDAFVLCRIFQKSGTGPKIGEEYGATFLEEEWDDDDELIMVPGEQLTDQVEVETEVWEDAYIGIDDLEQNLDLSIAPEKEPLLLDVNDGDQSSYCEYPEDLIEDDRNPIIGGREYLNDSELPCDQKHVDSLKNNLMDSRLELNGNHVDGTNSVTFPGADYLLDEPYFDATSNTIFGDEFFLETDDLLENNKMNPLNVDMVDEYLSFFDGEDNSIAFDSTELIASEEPFLDQKVADAPTAFTDKHLLDPRGNGGLSSSNQNCNDQNSDCENPFEIYSANMLASIPAPPAFASEFPSKDAIMRLTSATQSPASVHHATAGMIQIANMNGVEWSFPKHGTVDLTFFFALPQPQDHINSILSGKTTTPSILSRSWIYLIFLWGLVLSTSYKIGTCLYSH